MLCEDFVIGVGDIQTKLASVRAILTELVYMLTQIFPQNFSRTLAMCASDYLEWAAIFHCLRGDVVLHCIELPLPGATFGVIRAFHLKAVHSLLEVLIEKAGKVLLAKRAAPHVVYSGLLDVLHTPLTETLCTAAQEHGVLHHILADGTLQLRVPSYYVATDTLTTCC